MVKSPALIPFVPLIAAGIGAGTAIWSGNKAAQQNGQIQQGMAQTQQKQMGLFDQAQQLIPGMQGISQQYGQAAQGFLQDRAALDNISRGYGGLYDQMNRLYGQGNPAAEGMDLMRGMLSQDPTAAGRGALSGLLSRAAGSDDGAVDALRANAAGVLSATSPDVYREQARLAGNDAMGQLASQLASRGVASSGASSRLGASTLSRLYADAAARGQQDRLNAYGQSNSALSAAGNMALQRRGMEANLAGQLAGLEMQGQQHRAGLAGQLAGLGMQGGQYQAGLLGQLGNILGAQQGNILQGSGLLGNYLQALQGQYGMQQGIAGMYTQQGQALGGMWNQQASQVNPNPYGGVGAALGAIGNAGAQFMDWRAKGLTGGGFGGVPGGVPSPGFGVSYPGIGPAVMPRYGASNLS